MQPYENSWGKTRYKAAIYTFNLSPEQGNSNDFKFIKFYNADGSLPKNSSYSWDETRYYSKSINDVIQNNNLSKYMRNVKVTEYGPDNLWNSCNITICEDKQTLSLAAVLRINM